MDYLGERPRERVWKTAKIFLDVAKPVVYILVILNKNIGIYYRVAATLAFAGYFAISVIGVLRVMQKKDKNSRNPLIRN